MAPKKNINSKSSKRAPRPVSAPVARGVPSVNRSGQGTVRKQGTDYITVVEGDSWADGDTLFNVMVVPSLMPQLSKIAATYQKMKYHSLTFELSSHMPTSTAGGYIMAFVPDPADRLPAKPIERKQRMVSTPGSVKDSIWRSSRLTVREGGGTSWDRCLPNGYLFTSPGNDVRLHSPGTFNLVVDGKVTQPGSLSLSVHWDVTFHVESLEGSAEGAEEQLILRADLWGIDKRPYPAPASGSSTVVSWTSVFGDTWPGVGYVYESELPVSITTNVAANTSVITNNWVTTMSGQTQTLRPIIHRTKLNNEDDKFISIGANDMEQLIPSGQTFSLISTPQQDFQRVPRGSGYRIPKLKFLPHGGITSY